MYNILNLDSIKDIFLFSVLLKYFFHFEER
jgi:hypothetical protein